MLKNAVCDPTEKGRALLVEIAETEKETWSDIYRKTYYEPSDFSDSRYDPAFSPTLYPGQQVRFRVGVPEDGRECELCQYVRVRRQDSEELICSGIARMVPGENRELVWRIPTADENILAGGTILETGLRCRFSQGCGRLRIGSMETEGGADYQIDFREERVEKWNDLHREISQFTREKGLTYLEKGWLHLTGTDFAESYTGDWDWKDYEAGYELAPLSGKEHYALFRVQGARRCYGVGFTGAGRLGLWKKIAGDVHLLHEIPYAWEYGKVCHLKIKATGSCFWVYEGDRELFRIEDTDEPYLSGGIGLGVRNNSHCKYQRIWVRSWS